MGIFSGASLAQDRGSLEAKIDAQEKEISLVKKQLEVNSSYVLTTDLCFLSLFRLDLCFLCYSDTQVFKKNHLCRMNL